MQDWRSEGTLAHEQTLPVEEMGIEKLSKRSLLCLNIP